MIYIGAFMVNAKLTNLTASKPLTSKVKNGAIGGTLGSVATLLLNWVLPQIGVVIDPTLQQILMSLITLASAGTGSWFTSSKRSDYVETKNYNA